MSIRAIAVVAALVVPTLAQAQTPMVSGTVQKVEADQGKLTIQHGKIPNLDMDAMTMVFRAKDAGMLKNVKAGDKVRFSADRVNGQITVTKIEKSK